MQKIYTIILVLCFSLLNIQAQTYENISIQEAQALIAEQADNPIFTILDVRTADEYNGGHIANAYNRDFYASDFEQQLDLLHKERVYLIYCRSGNRSGQTLSIMENLGFNTVYNMLGGTLAWDAANYPLTTELPPEQDLTTSVYNMNTISLKTWPNPVLDQLQLSDTYTGQVHIYNAKAQCVYTAALNGNTIDVSHLSNGLYTLKLVDKREQTIYVSRFVK